MFGINFYPQWEFIEIPHWFTKQDFMDAQCCSISNSDSFAGETGMWCDQIQWFSPQVDNIWMIPHSAQLVLSA